MAMYMYGKMPGDQIPGILHPYGKTQPRPIADKMAKPMQYGGPVRPDLAPGGVGPGAVTPGGSGPGVAPGGLAPGGYVPGGVTPQPTQRPRHGEAVRPTEEAVRPMRPGIPPQVTDADRAGLIQRLERYMKDQVTAAAFYRELEGAADDARVKEYLRHAREDEQKHYRLLRQRYQALTGRRYEATPSKITYTSLTDGLLKAVDDEIEAYEEYRDEYLRQTDPRDRQLFFELMTDEIEHATRFNTALLTLR